ncbi:MAG: ABC transporter ATP-binding protein [Spirochaetales bacterium]|nr:ABC transporter ATP-binding protein [Spirochaetales bacterium]
MLKFENVSTYYGNIQALKNLTLEIQKGEIVTLIGANGAGKSTTLMTLSGVVPPRSGRIIYKDEDITHCDTDLIVQKGIIQVPEGRHIFPYLSVQENLDLGAYLRNDKQEIKNDLEYVFSLFPRLAERRHQQGGTLSGGEQQMLAISRGLMARPEVLLLDEPSLGLAPILVQQIFDTIRQINKENGTTIFLVEQNANQALKTAHKGYVMETGKIILADTAENLLTNDEVISAYLGGA